VKQLIGFGRIPVSFKINNTKKISNREINGTKFKIPESIAKVIDE